ncbi:hypothetical protein FDECE_15620 [Fusarium decemcellulare]|nr:hypothetical protein FDECE_15620 [Fusarium decemcellulare]
MKVIALVLLALTGSSLAGKHHNCGCNVRGQYNVALSQATCALWGSSQIHTHFDGYSCIDKGSGRGIDGQPWENTCKQAWDINFGGNKDDVLGFGRGNHHKYIDDVEDASENGCYICFYLLFQLRQRNHETLGLRRNLAPQVGSLLKYSFYSSFLEVGPPDASILVWFRLESGEYDTTNHRNYLESVKKDLSEGNQCKVRDDGLRGSNPTLSNTGDATALDYAKKSLKNCVMNHDGCRDAISALASPETLTSEEPWHPGRLIDCSIADDHLHLVRGEDLESPEPFATLSYCWGKEKFFTLSSENEQEALSGTIALTKLPLAFREAIMLCRVLDIKYLWIDSICIIQSGDRGKDWESHAREMSKIYALGFLNIAVEHASNPSQGLFIDRYLYPPLVTAPSGELGKRIREIMRESENFWSRRKRNGTSLPDEQDQVYRIEEGQPYFNAKKAIYHTKLSTRGWVMQELYLSRRTLHFTQRRIAWSCCHESTVEGDGKRGPNCLERLTPPLIQRSGHPDIAWNWWLDRVEEYSQRQLSFPEKDMLIAIAGIARIFNSERQLEYLAGMFRPHLHWALLWRLRPTEDGGRMKPVQLQESKQFRPQGVPSWSWASVNFPIMARITHLARLPEATSLVDIEHAEVELCDPSNPYGQVRGGKIELEGYLGLKESFSNYREANHDGRYDQGGKPVWHLPLIWVGNEKWVTRLNGLLIQEDEASDAFYRVGVFRASGIFNVELRNTAFANTTVPYAKLQVLQNLALT